MEKFSIFLFPERKLSYGLTTKIKIQVKISLNQ